LTPVHLFLLQTPPAAPAGAPAQATDYLQKIQDLITEYAPKVAAALIILIVGWIVARIAAGVLHRILRKSRVDETLSRFLVSLVKMGLLAFVVVAAISKLGVETASFIAILGAAGFAVGFALQGSLANLASGVLLMVFRPMKKNDLVEAGGVLGTVEEIGIFATILNTPDNKRAIIANATITGGNIVNYTANGSLRVDMVFGIGYGDDIGKAIGIMEEVLAADPRVLKEPEPQVAVCEHGASSVNLVCRPFVHPSDYWGVRFDTHRKVKEAFDAAGVTIPFPQRDVHLMGAPPATAGV